MFYSQCLLSRKGPLSAVWVAAYCHKRLNKTQIAETDISSSIEKILLEDFPKVASRVLGYLLLGVVRIYSKKVEYLFNDCHEVLIKVNDFTATNIVNAAKKAEWTSLVTITLPDRFELDAFDLQNFNDSVKEVHVRPPKDIILEDVWRNETCGFYPSDESFHEEDSAKNFVDTQTPAKSVQSPVTANMFTKLSESERSTEMLRDIQFSREECEDQQLFYEIMKRPSNLNSEEHCSGREEINRLDTTFTENVQSHFVVEDLVDGLSCPLMDIDMAESSLLHNPSVEAAMMKLQESGTCQQEDPGLEGVDEKENESDKYQMQNAQPGTIAMDAAKESNILPASGPATPDFKVITPAINESTRKSRKRKSSFDEILVLPNKELKENLDDSSDLICKRRKVPETALDVWKACQIPILSHGFLEPLFPYGSIEIRSLFMEIQSEAKKPVDLSEDLLVSPSVEKSLERAVLSSASPIDPSTSVMLDEPFERFSEQTVIHPETPLDPSTSVKVDEPGSLSFGRSPDHNAIAPDTPVEHSISRRSRRGLEDSDRWGSSSSLESLERELSPTENQDLELNLMNEDVYSCEEHQCDRDNWSVVTRAVAGYLQNSFQNQRKQGKEEVVSLFKVLKRRSRKVAARLFYEILVLKSGGYVDVMQSSAYDNILVLNLPKS